MATDLRANQRDMSAQAFPCPSCGATVETAGLERTVKCPYCGTVAQVPDALWQPAEQARTVRKWKRWIIIFLVVTVVLPTCLGLAGTALGVGAGILGAIVPFVLAILGR